MQSEATLVNGGKLYWTDNDAGKIQVFSNGVVADVITGLQDPRGIALAGNNFDGKMFYAENGNNTISRANLQGGERQVLFSGLSFPADVEYDIAGDQIYFTDRDANTIYRGNTDGTGLTIVPITGVTVSAPYFMELDEVNQKIYWTEFDSRLLYRANYDGSGGELVRNIGDRLRDIVVLNDSNQLLIADRNDSVIFRVDNYGSGTSQIIYNSANGLDRPHGMVAYEGLAYWADTDTNDIKMGSIDGIGGASVLANTGPSGGFLNPWDIDVINDVPVPGTLVIFGVVGMGLMRRRTRC